jgi:hypothetical protein
MNVRDWMPAGKYFFSTLAGALLLGFSTWKAWPVRPDRPPVTEPASPAVVGPPLFRDVTGPSGVSATYRNGEEAGLYTLLETLGGGVALLDYDGDGLLDIFIPGGGYFDGQCIHGHPSKLYRNLGNWRFQDVTREVGLDQPLFYTHGCAVADYDRDGWPDLLVTGWGRVVLYHNEPDGKGGRRFVDVTARAGLTTTSWSTSAAWGDLDGDGYPELYLCHYCDWSLTANHPTNCNYDGKTRDVCSPALFTALPHRLYRNNGNGTFTDVSKEAGLRVEHPKKEYGRGLGVLFVDVDGDGKPDIYVANDLSDKFLYLNRSTPGKLCFEEVGLLAGVARDDRGQVNGSMGLAAADWDGCGRPSLWVTNYAKEDHALYRPEASTPLHFRFCTHAAGIGAVGRIYVGWGTGFFDIDHHGWEDLFFAAGHERRHPEGQAPRGQRPVLLRNEGGRFTPLTARGGSYFDGLHLGRGVALGDLDNDGRIDLVISHVNEPAVLLRNEAAEGNHWLGIELIGRDNADVVGARLCLEAGGRRQTRFAQGGGSYASSGDRRHVFGLGTAPCVERLTVTWASGRVHSWEGLAVDRYWRIVEGLEPK